MTLNGKEKNKNVGSKEIMNNSVTKNENVDAEKILNKFGRFQYQSLLQICPTYAMIAAVVISHIFLNITPEHICKQPGFTDVRFHLHSM